MNTKIKVVVGVPPQQFALRHETVGHILLPDGREIPAMQVEEESCSEDDPNRPSLRNSWGPVLAVGVMHWGDVPPPGETVRFRYMDSTPAPFGAGILHQTYEVE